LGAVQKKLSQLVGKSSGYLESLPQQVQDRVAVLQKLNTERTSLEDRFQKEVAELQRKYEALYQPLYAQRTKIVNGDVEPTAAEIEAAKKELAEKKKAEDEAAKAAGLTDMLPKPAETKSDAKPDNTPVKGVPQFWLTVLQHHDDIAEMIEETDVPALQHLTDITYNGIDNEEGSFRLQFHFSENPFFSNKTLSKTYHLVSMQGEMMYDHVEADEIEWKDGKNLTVKKVTKTQKKKGGRGKGRGGAAATRTITVEEPCQSFFNFFSPETNLPEDLEAEEVEEFLEDDYYVGLEFKEKLIPNAVGWFTGEASVEDDGRRGRRR